MPEVELDDSYKEKLIYKHSVRGQIDKKILSIKRRGKKKYAKAGCVVGLVFGVLVAIGLLFAWGWIVL
jgi:uncharacterized membrane protein